MTKTGKCRMCLFHAELQDSHLLPKWMYRAISDRDDPTKKPIAIKGGNSFYTNSQERLYLLCSVCERRFSSREDYVSKLANTGKTPLLERLSNGSKGKVKHELVPLPSDIDKQELVYFALSVIWRYAEKGTINLGPYKDNLRQYLLNPDLSLLDNINVFMQVVDDRQSHGLSHTLSTPMSKKFPNYRVHFFFGVGIRFYVAIAKCIPDNIKQLNLLNEVGYCLLVPPDEDHATAFVIKEAQRSVSKGKLAKE